MGSGSGLVVVECDGRDVKERRFVVQAIVDCEGTLEALELQPQSS